MKLTRRFLALLLALSMSLSLVTPAFASELETEETAEPVVAAETEAVEVVETEAAKPETEAPEVVETEAPEVVETEAPEVVVTEAPEVETEAPASASLVAAAPAANAEGTEMAEYEVDYETQLVIGENALTLLTTATTTIYEFSPEEAGIYQFAADDANALVGYWGAGSYYVWDQTENKTNTLEYTLTNAGPSIMVGISGVESCTLTVTRLGDAVVEPSYEKVDYTNVVTPEAYTMPEAATDLVYVDVTDDVADAAVLGEDGYYHLNAADGPILYVDLGYNAPYGAPLANAAGYGSVKVAEYDENGKIVKLVNYLPAIEAYQACVASATVGETEASLYPLTEDLMIMYQKIGADKGWYDADTITGFFLFEGYTIDEETAWLFSCCYSENYTSAASDEETEQPGASAENPVSIDNVNAPVAGENAAGATVYYQAYFNGSMDLTIEDAAGLTVVYNGGSYSADENGTIKLAVTSSYWSPAVFSVVNGAEEAASYSMVFSLPAGSMSNPAEAVEGENTADVEANSQGYFFTYTAPADGELTFTMNTETGWFYVINNTTAGIYGDNQCSDSDPVVATQTVSASAGDEIQIIVNTYDPADMWNTPAGTISFSLSYEIAYGSSAEYPIFVDASAPVSGENAANSTVYYNGYIFDMYLTIENAAGLSVELNGETYPADENGTVSVYFPASAGMSRPMPAAFSVKNSSAESVSYTMNFAYPVGNSGNPAVAVEGQNSAAIEEGSQGYYFTYTAPEDGELTFAMNTESGWFYVINNITANAYGDNQYSDSDPVVSNQTLYLSKGDEIQIIVNTYDPETPWAAPAGEIGFSLSYLKYGRSADTPITIDDASVPVSGEVEAGQTIYYSGYIFDMYLTIENAAGLSVELNGETYSADENGTISVYFPASTSLGRPMPVAFTVTNSSEETVSYSMVFEYPLGNMDNPAEVVLDAENTVEIAAGSQGYYYTFTAPDRGNLVFTMNTESGWTYAINNLTSGIYGDTQWSDSDPVPYTQSVAANAGDEIQIIVNTYDPTAWSVPEGTLSFTAAFEYAPGTASNPEYPAWEWNDAGNEATASVTVPAGTTYYLAITQSDMLLTIDDGEPQKVNGSGWYPQEITITNDGIEEAVYELYVYYPIGHYNRPDAAALGENTAAIEEGNNQGYHYTWTAKENGLLTVTMNSENWQYTINNETAWRYGETHTSGDESVVSTESVAVEAGDVIRITVNTYDPADPWAYPAGTVVFTTAFHATDIELVSGKSTTLKFINPNTGKKVSGSKVNWTIDAAYVIDPDGAEVEYADVSAYGKINKSGKLTTYKCGDKVGLYITGTLKADPTVSVSYYVDLYPASTKLGIWRVYDRYVDEWGYEYVEKDPVYYTQYINITGLTQEDAPAYEFEATSYPVNSLGKVTWKSSSKKIATVDENGVVSPVWNAKKNAYNTGTVTITATAADGSGKKASFKIQFTKYAQYITIEREDGVAFEEIPINWYNEWNEETEEYEQIVTESARGLYLNAGESIDLKATVDPNGTNKTFAWGCYSDFATISKKGVLTISEDAPDDTWVWIGAYTTKGDYVYDEILVKVINEPSTEPLAIYGSYYREDYNSWWNADYDAVLDVSTGTEEAVPTLKLRSYVEPYTADQTVVWEITKGTNLAELSDGTHLDVWYDSEGNEYSEEIPVKVVTPKWDEEAGAYKTGTITLTASTPDGSVKSTYKVSITNLVSSLEIVTKNGKNMETRVNEVWNEDTWSYDYVDETVIVANAGQSLNLKAVPNSNAAKKSVYWWVSGTSNAKISSSGKLTIAKDTPEYTEFYVYAQAKDNGGFVNKIKVVVTPLAVNVHVRADIDGTGTLKYVSNTTHDWDVTTDGKTLELGSLVYPFDASQEVKWATSNTKIAYVESYEYTEWWGETVTGYRLVFTGTKYGKLTVTATAQDGTKQKASFTLNVSASIDNLELPEELATYSKKSMNLANMVVFNGGEITPSNKTLTWKLYELVPVLDANGEVVTDDLGAVIHNWQECAKNNGSAAKLTSKGVFTAKTVKEYTYVKVEASKGDIKDEVYIEIYPAGVNNIKAEAFSGMKNVDGEEISVVFAIDSIVTVEKNGVITTTDDIVALSAWSANNKWTAPFAYEVDNENFVVELVTLLFPAGVDDEGNAIYEEGIAYAVYAADEQNPYGTVNVTIKSTDGTNKTLPFTVVFEAPVEEPAE